MTDPDDMPTVDADEVDVEDLDVDVVDVSEDPPEGAFSGVEAIDFETMSADDFSDPNESLVRSFDDDMAAAVNSAAWHTIIDGSGHEDFVDDLTVEHMRDAIGRLQSNGFATERLSLDDVWHEGGDDPSGAAFFMGGDVADDFAEIVDNISRAGVYDDDPESTRLDGFRVEVEDGLPSHLIVLVDVDAIGRVPPHARNVPMGLDTTPSVSSPVVVTQEDGIAVINVAQQ